MVRRSHSKILQPLRPVFALLICLGLLQGCDTGGLIGLAFHPPTRHPIDPATTGVNDFFVNPEFGSTSDQYSDIHGNLKLNFVRVLLAWTDSVQPTPDSAPEYSFYDSILSRIPPGVDVLVVLSHVPSWMTNPDNWTSGGDPRQTFVTRWVQPTAARYAHVPGIIGYEIWNEPDAPVLPSDEALGLTDATLYVPMLAAASNAIRSIQPRKLVIGAATESIQQNFPNHLNYNKKMKDLGAEALVDIWNVHYYGKGYESVVTSNGVASFLNGLTVPIWVTESGEQGVNEQLAYVETTWPFLKDKVSSIERFYYYQYSGTEPVDQNYGLKTTDPQFPVSDLYVSLKNR